MEEFDFKTIDEIFKQMDKNIEDLNVSIKKAKELLQMN